MAKRRKSPQVSRVRRPDVHRAGFSRGPQARPAPRRTAWPWLAGGAVVVIGLVALVAFYAGLLPLGQQPTPSPTAGRSFDASVLHPPSATPLASPPAQPSGDGSTATITTDLGDIVIQLYTASSPVAAQNFINLASAGFYNGLTFHRIVPGFVIQGGDPNGDGTGGPGYTIADEPVVGDYTRGIVAMARTSLPHSAGSQFFIVLDDSVAQSLPKSGDYAIFGKVISGMDVADQIAQLPNSGAPNNLALTPLQMTQVTIQPPSS
jgi:peptidyl-prolyl cis-trans isomerase B (cyclophilin B)